MNYYLDTEFIEGPQSKLFGLFKSKPTIDLISIAIVCEDSREYYVVSKDFNLKEAWNRCDIHHGIDEEINKIYWIRENVLRPIYEDFIKEYFNDQDTYRDLYPFDYQTMKRVIEIVGKPNKVIAKEIIDFVSPDISYKSTPQFYGYFCDYDWVALCWLFGYMIDLPEGFPMYARDLKQMLDEKAEVKKIEWGDKAKVFDMLNHIKTSPDYPKQSNEHHPLHDARWNKKLHQFIMSL